MLLELVNPANAGSITGNYILKANNPDYQDMVATDAMRTLARFKAIIDPLEMVVA